MTKTGETTQSRPSAAPESDSVRRDAIARQTSAWLFTLSEDENRVIAEIVSRVRKAVPQYGHVDIRADKRDFRQERAEEIFDATFYAGLEWLKRHVARVDAVTAPDAASVEDYQGDTPRSERVREERSDSDASCDSGRSASDARGLVPISAPADTVVPHDGERMHGGNFIPGQLTVRGRCRCSREAGDSDCDVHPTCDGCGADLTTLNEYTSPPWKRLCRECYVLNAPSDTLSAAGRHGARRDDATPLDPGHETPTGGDSHPSSGSQRVGGVSALGRCRCDREQGDSDCDVHPTCEGCGRRLDGLTQYQSPPWKRLCVECYREESKRPVNAGLREPAAATPQVAAPGVADEHTLWSAEMVDGRFDDGGES